MSDTSTPTARTRVAVGDPIGPVTHRPDHVMLFQYSAILWNPHRIHYDTEYARDVAGHPDLVVPGPMQGTFLEQLLTAWAGSGRLVGLRYRNRASAYVGQELTAHGTVAEVRDDGTVRCEVVVTNGEGVTTTAGEGIVAL
jgi:3-methylfumaryl-CoA hydratase